MSLGINVMAYDVITVTTVPVSCNVLVDSIYTEFLIFVCKIAVIAFIEVDHFCEKGGSNLYSHIILKPSHIVKGHFTLVTNSLPSLYILPIL